MNNYIGVELTQKAEARASNWTLSVEQARNSGTLTQRAYKAATAMCPVIMWAHDDTPLAVAHGALYGIEQGLSRMTFYRAGNDLVDAGLIAIHSGRWHATINGRRVAGGEDA